MTFDASQPADTRVEGRHGAAVAATVDPPRDAPPVILLRWLAPARLPALLRLDSLFLAGPAWVAAVAVLLHR